MRGEIGTNKKVTESPLSLAGQFICWAWSDALEHIFTTKGRMSLSAYLVVSFPLIGSVFLFSMANNKAAQLWNGFPAERFASVWSAWLICVLLAHISLIARRYHDTGTMFSQKFHFVSMFSIWQILKFFFIIFVPGDMSPNDFGPPHRFRKNKYLNKDS